jgi:hypothetical protein
MAIGAITVSEQAGQRVSAPGPRAIPLQFLGDSDYPAGGTPNFEDLVRAALPGNEFVTIVTVTQGDCGGYQVTYDRENDKLKLWVSADAAPNVENTTADLAAVTFNVVVWVK